MDKFALQAEWFTRSLARNGKKFWDWLLGVPAHESEIGRNLQNDPRHLSKITLNEIKFPSSDIVWGRHAPDEIARALKKFVSSQKRGGKNYGINSTQRTGIYEYNNLRKLASPDHPDAELLEKYYRAFNKIFFLGALRNLSEIEFHGPNPAYGGDCSSQRSAPENIPINRACLIRIYQRTFNKNEDNDARLREYLGTLLHEMLHGMFAAFCCYCSEPCQKSYAELVGPRGHQSSWQIAASAIENATTLLLGETIHLGHHRSLAHDWHVAGAMPSENEIDVTVFGTTYNELRVIFNQYQYQSSVGL